MKEFVVFIALLALSLAAYTYNYISVDLATFFAFILVVGLLIYRDRKKVKFESIVFIRRTKKGRDFIDRTAKKHRTFWSVLGTLGVIIMIPTLVLGSFFLITQAAKIAGGEKEGGVRLLLPGPVSAPTNLPGAFVVPWWIWVIGIAVVIVPHEFMHGIMCRLDKIRIKSVGWILLLIIPGAFVEPDEKQLKKAKRSTKMKVYAAGSFANVLIAFIVLGLLMTNYAANFENKGVFVQTLNNTPGAALGDLTTIIAIDNYEIRSAEDLRSALLNYDEGDTVTVKTLEGDLIAPAFSFHGIGFMVPRQAAVTNTTQPAVHSVTLDENNQTGKGYLGVGAIMESVSYKGDNFESYKILTLLLSWIYVFNLGIGIVNILPIKPLDGGLLFEEIAGHFTKRQKTVVKAVSTVMLLVLIFNLIGPLFL